MAWHRREPPLHLKVGSPCILLPFVLMLNKSVESPSRPLSESLTCSLSCCVHQVFVDLCPACILCYHSAVWSMCRLVHAKYITGSCAFVPVVHFRLYEPWRSPRQTTSAYSALVFAPDTSTFSPYRFTSSFCMPIAQWQGSMKNAKSPSYPRAVP